MAIISETIERKNDPDFKKWSALMAECRESGLSAKEWVRQRDDITYAQFRIAKEKYFPEEIRRSDFLDKQTEWSALSVEIPSTTLDLFIRDCRIELTPGFDQELLLEVLEVIRRED